MTSSPVMRPNIVFILVDDLGWADLACTGSSFYETPRLDQLAAAGIRFTDAYAAAPVCSPTRASILTGKYPARVGLTQWIGGHAVGKLQDVPYFACLPAHEYTLARALRGGGYASWNVGKWHLGALPHMRPECHGFDVNIGGTGHGAPPMGYFAPYGLDTLTDGPDGEYLTDRLTDEAISLIEGSGEQPFFLHLSHYAVHTPVQAPAELIDKYIKKAAELGLDHQQAIMEGEDHPTWHKYPERIQRRMIQSDPTYAAMMENLDTNIGRLLDALEVSGKAENTIVVFTSDNGGLSTAEGSPTSNLPLSEGKGWTRDGGLRVPLLVRWPGVIEPGTVTDAQTTSADFYPTFLDVAGLPLRPDQHVDGVSITAALHGATFDRGALFWHYPHYANQGGRPSSAIRVGRWKLIEQFEDGRCELYDLVADIGEQHNLADDAHYVQIRVDLLDKLRAFRAETHALVPEPNMYERFPGSNPYGDST